MTKGLRRTGRRKAPFTGKRVISRKQRYVAPKIYRSLGYTSTMPQAFKSTVSWRFETEITMDNSYRVVAYHLNMYEPARINIANAAQSLVAGNLLGLMSIYSKCSVLKTTVRAQFQSLGSGLDSLLELTSGVLSLQDSLQYPNNDGSTMDLISFDRLRTVPGSKYYLLGDSTGGNPYVHDFQTVDVQKFIGQPLDTRHCSYASNSSTTNTLTLPASGDINVVGRLPTYTVCLRQNTNSTADVRVRFSADVSCQCEFTAFRPQPGQVQFALPWTVVVAS